MECTTSEWKGIASRFGGFWRYPQMKDYCFLVNPYFPTPEMVREIQQATPILLTSYPSGMRSNAQYAADMFGVPVDYIVPGNGASELIKIFMEELHDKVGFVYPTFEEYPNRVAESQRVVFHPPAEDFSYSGLDLIRYFSDRDISCLCLVNPDNPSGNLLLRPEIEEIALWAGRRAIKVLIDESFADFADSEKRYTLLDAELLSRYPNLYVIKSIGKSFGVPGCRLGILATADVPFVAMVKKRVSIWNINPFGEFFMEQAPRYHNEYVAGCDKIEEERKRFIDELRRIPMLKVFDSQANYILVRVCGRTATELTDQLWNRYRILLKDCSSKKGFSDDSYVRLTIRDQADNDCLLKTLREL